MSEQAEKLVEELDRLFIEECGNESLTPYLELDEGDRWVVEQGWGKIITLIGQAYADGMPLPGEVGPRWEQYVYPCHEFADWCEEMYEADAKTLIALSPFPREGTGKEEEE